MSERVCVNVFRWKGKSTVVYQVIIINQHLCNGIVIK